MLLSDVMRSFSLALAVLVIGIVGCAPPAEKQVEDKSPAAVTSAPSFHEIGGFETTLKLSQLMQDSIKEARAELPVFWKAWEEGTWGKGDYIVCAQFISEDGNEGEFLWISVQAIGEGEVTGMMEGNPEIRKDIKHGEVVTVKEKDIADWMYVPDDGDHKGGYTLKALGDPVEK